MVICIANWSSTYVVGSSSYLLMVGCGERGNYSVYWALMVATIHLILA